MTPFQPTHVHKETGEQFIVTHDLCARERRVMDKYGFYFWVDVDRLAPIQPIEEWEPVDGSCVTTQVNGRLVVKISNPVTWVDYPHPDVRLVDGCRLERRKA